MIAGQLIKKAHDREEGVLAAKLQRNRAKQDRNKGQMTSTLLSQSPVEQVERKPAKTYQKKKNLQASSTNEH